MIKIPTVVSDIHYPKMEESGIFADEDTLYLFGDNVVRAGRGGQAGIRRASNSIGIITKRLPSNTRPNSFLTDDVLDLTSGLIINDIRRVVEKIQNGDYERVHIPAAGLGTGLANLKQTAPKTFKFLSYHLKRAFDFDNPGWDGKLK